MPSTETLNFFQPGLALLMAGIFVLAGLVKGVVGLGLPTIAMALLALNMAPAEAAALLIIPSLITNLWQLRPWRSLGPMLKRLAPMQAGVCAGTLAGAWFWGAPAGAWAEICLGMTLMAYAAWGLTGAQLQLPAAGERWLAPVVGLVTGMVTAATGVFMLPAVPYLQALRLPRDALIQAMGISFTVSTLALAAGLSMNMPHPTASLGVSALMLLPALAGMALGQRLRRNLSADLFRRCFMSSLLLLGLHILIRGGLAQL